MAILIIIFSLVILHYFSKTISGRSRHAKKIADIFDVQVRLNNNWKNEKIRKLKGDGINCNNNHSHNGEGDNIIKIVENGLDVIQATLEDLEKKQEIRLNNAKNDELNIVAEKQNRRMQAARIAYAKELKNLGLEL